MVGATLTLIAAWLVLEVMVVAGDRLGVWYNLAVHGLYLVVSAGLELGLLAIALDIVDGGRPTYGDLFVRLGQGPRFLAAQLVYLLMVLAGLVALVAPGIWIGVRFLFFGFTMAEGEDHPLRALRQAVRLVRGRSGALFRLAGVLVLVNLLGASLLGVGLLVSFPTSVLALASLFRQLEAGEELRGESAAAEP